MRTFTGIRAALVMFALLTLLTGVAYPLLVTGLAQVIFPVQANGSMIRMEDGTIQGSALIGQLFDDPKYFWGRLSATGGQPYNAAASSGSNYSVLNENLFMAANDRIQALQAADPGNTQPIPVDLVTASGSGLDPHISPAAALYQAPRVARVRGLGGEVVRQLVLQHVEEPFLGFMGEARVNVLTLNLALDAVP